MKMVEFHQTLHLPADSPVLVRADAVVAVEEIPVPFGRGGDNRTRIRVEGGGVIEVTESFAQVRKAIQEALETAAGAQ